MKYSLAFILLVFTSLAYADDVPENIVTIENNSVILTEHEGLPILSFRILVKEGFFAYQEKFEININNFNTLDVSIDPVVSFFDKTFQKTKHGVRNQAKITAPIKIENKANFDEIKINLTYQACTPDYCLFPTQTKLTWQPKPADKEILRKSVAPPWMQRGLFVSLAFVFVAGLLTSLTPCVYPMLPITLAVLGASNPKSRRDGFIKSLTYVLGMAFTYATLGLLAASTGFLFGSMMSNSYFLGALTLILFVGALSMYDVLEIKAPQALSQKLANNQSSTSYFALFATGLFSGLMVGPCVGPVLIGILGFVSQTGSLALGFSLLFTFAIGLGTLIIVLGTFSGLIQKIPRSGTWMVKVKKALGLVFLGLALYFLAPVLDFKQTILAGFLLLGSFSLVLVLVDFKSKTFSFAPFTRAIFRSILIFSALGATISYQLPRERLERLVGYNYENFGNSNWDIFTEEKLALAKDRQNFVVLDFYADWCAACRELKHKTFAKNEIAQFSPKIKWLYFDSTVATDKLKALKEKYKILGLPTVLFFDSHGEVREDLTLTGFEGPKEFANRLEKLISGEKE